MPAAKTLMGRLAGKRALMTGAGGMLGSDLARAFAAQGADLVLTTRAAAKLEPLAQEVRGLGVRAAVVGADFTRETDIDHLAEAAWRAFGGIDVVLLSSQPAQPHMGDLLSTTDEAWREQQQSIIWGPFRLLRQLAPKMMAAGGGSIITFVSSTGIDPTPGYGAYGLAKGALRTLTRYMAAEWGKRGIRANSICPGLIATGGSGAPTREQVPPSMLARTALGRLGHSSEVIGAAIYLASDESSFTTDQCIHVNGGRF
jgi:NAD(P)-dependent dehydrogenase (short-subunit alcohol dehydrogenase family)